MANKKTEANAEVVKTETKVEVKETKKKSAFTQSFYIGPSIKGVISTRSTFLDGIPAEKVDEIATRIGINKPMIEALFIPIEELGKAREELNKQSRLATIYKTVAKAINK